MIDDGVNPAVRLDQLRIFVWVRLAGEFALRQAVFDTGAPFTILPKQVWLALHARGEVSWVAHHPATSGKDRLPVVVIGGATYPYRLARVDVQVARLAGSEELRPVPVLVQCLEDDPPTAMKARPILGLAGGLLHGRQLVIEAAADGRTWTAAVVEP